jgi:cell division protein FtsB
MKRQRTDSGVDHGWMGAMNRAMRWCLFLGIIGFIVAQYVPLIQKNHRLRKSLSEWKESESRLASVHGANRKRIHDLKENPVVIERTAREMLQLARPGESVVTFLNPTGAGPSSSPSAAAPAAVVTPALGTVR